MNFIKYFMCGALLVPDVAVFAQTNEPPELKGLNAVACEISATLESSIVKTMSKTQENLEYLDTLQKMSDGYFKIKVNEFNAGRLTKARAGEMSDLVVGNYLSDDLAKSKKARRLLKDCIELGVVRGVFQP